MKKTLLLALTILLALPGFAKKGKHSKRMPIVSKKGIQSVTMHRTACFGRCPDYMVTINTDGMATYTGIRFTKDTGIFTKNIGKKAAMEIINGLADNKVDTCRNLYENRIPDLPGIRYTIVYKDSTKNISNANWGPTFLKLTADAIDHAGKKGDDNNSGWKRAEPGKKK